MQYHGPHRQEQHSIRNAGSAIGSIAARKITLLLQLIDVLDRERRELLAENRALREAAKR